jgi:hypothetical protein
MRNLSSLDVMWKWDYPQYKHLGYGDRLAKMCVGGAPWDSAKLQAIVWGDSHAAHMTAPLLGPRRAVNPRSPQGRALRARGIDGESARRAIIVVATQSRVCD